MATLIKLCVRDNKKKETHETIMFGIQTNWKREEGSVCDRLINSTGTTAG